jgi:predicted nucleic acid-binding protein
MVRLILDTNVWLDWLVFEDPRIVPLGRTIEAGAATVLATAPMLGEFAEVIRRPHFGLTPERCERLRERQAAVVEQHAPAPDCRLPCTDAADQMFIDLAVAHRVDWLLSRDKALLRLRRIAARRFGLHVGTPEDWRAAAAPSAPYNPVINEPYR